MKANPITVLIGVAVACVLIAVVSPKLPLDYDSGQRIGIVAEIEQTGPANWEGTLSFGVGKRVPIKFKKNGSVINYKYVPDVWHFSVVDPQVAGDLLLAVESQKQVKLSYKRYMNGFLMQGRADDYVVDVDTP